MVSQNPPPTSTVPATHDTRFLRYQDVLAKMPPQDRTSKSKQYPNENTPSASEGWLSDDDEVEEVKGCTPVKSEGIGPLLGGFADADSAE
jgi:hypothetical protein